MQKNNQNPKNASPDKQRKPNMKNSHDTKNIQENIQENIQDRKILLKISHLKQYFPLKKEMFSRKQEYVKANDDISINIYEGETLGLVGESGCGKSTFGRVLLQLYHQTDGKTMYYGKTVDSLAPKYLKDTLTHIDAKRNLLKERVDKRDAFIKEYDTLPEEQRNDKKEERDRLCKEANDLFLDITQIIGGFIVVPKLDDIIAIYLREYSHALVLHDLNRDMQTLDVEKAHILGKIDDIKAAKKSTSSYENKLAAVNEKITAKQKEINATLALIQVCLDELDEKRKPYKDNEDFQKYQTYKDDGIDLAQLSYKEMRQLRSDLQLIFQDPYSSLNPRMTVGQIIGEGLLSHNFFKKNDSKMQNYVMKVMEDCGLASYMIHRYPHQFSGGQRQRIGIARSLALKPKFVICDEAVSALDVSIQSQVINLLQDLKEKEKLTYLFISHDLSVVKYISDRIGVMYLGSIVEMAPAQRIFENPLHPYTEALLLAIPTTDVETKRAVVPLEGDIPSPINPPKGCKFHTRCKYCTDICKKVTPDFVEIEKEHFVACHHMRNIHNDTNF